MASRFWVGGTGNITDNTNHWSATSGGAPGASLPTSADAVFFDALSFSGAGQTVTLDGGIACLSMDWTGATNSPTFAGSQAFDVYGSLTFIAAMTLSITPTVTLRATSSGKTFTSAGQTLLFNINFTGVGAVYTLQDNLTFSSTKGITFQTGTLDTNGKNINCGFFNGSGSNVRTLTLGASTITCNAGITNPWNMTTVTNLTFNANTSTIIMGSGTTGFNFVGGGLTYYNFRTSAATITMANHTNTFNTITIDAGCTLKLPPAFTTTITTIVANGTPASKVTLQSSSSGSQATLSKASGISVIRNATLKDIVATGGATFYALGTTNVSGNTGWTYQMLIKQEKLSSSLMALYHIDSNGVLQKVSG